MTIQTLVVEVTRRCNLSCSFCLRGKAEKLDFDPKYLEIFLRKNNVEYINDFVFTGGETFLTPEIMEDCLIILKNHRITVGLFYIATNATIINDKIERLLLDLYMYGNSYEHEDFPLVDISNHPEYDEIDRSKVIRRLRAYKFTTISSELKDDNYILQGRAMENYGYGFNKHLNTELYIDDDSIEMVYLNAKGKVIPDCDYSYENQEDVVVANFNENLMRKLKNGEKENDKQEAFL